MPALFWLWPRLFRGVTPDRHAGETYLAVVHAGLHIPATRWIGILPKESPDRCGTCAIYRTANYHTGAGNYQYPWCDLNVPLVT